MRSLACAALFFSCAFAVAAQSRSETPAPKTAKKDPPPGTLHALNVRGNQLYSSAGIQKELGLHLGQRVDPRIIEQARKKLLGTELFSNVTDEYRFSGSVPPEYSLTFEVTEIQQIFPMRFERLGVSPDALKQYLQTHVDLYSDRIPGTDGVLHRYSQAVEQFLTQANRNVKVKAAISNDDPQQLTVLFTPDTRAPTIAQVTVTGNQAIDTGTILRAVNQVAVGVPLSDTRLKLILDGTIKPLYAAKGYAAVTFPKVETEPSKSNLGVVVKVDIKEGPLFKFGLIRFHGSGLDEDEIRDTIPFKPGQTFSSDQVDKFRVDLQHRMRRRGLLDASVTTQAQTDDSKRAVNITYNVIPGEVYNFETLDINGLDITAQPAIARLWGEKAGHPFNPDYPDFFLKRVRQEGIFDNLGDTHSDYTADASTHNVTVHLYFKGGKTQAQREKEKQEEKDKRTVDGTWSPWPE